ncbi:MAG: DUF4159 domain-containing protein [Planctomycetales bacterium]
MARHNISITSCLVAAIMLIAPLAHGEDEISAEKVRKSIDRGVRFLKQQQGDDGNWQQCRPFVGGVTALCLLALLEAGVPDDDRVIREGLTYLRSNQVSAHTYTISLQTMVFCRVGQARDRATIKRNVKWLEANQISTGIMQGAWAYPGVNQGDGSNTQFAILALHEAVLAGFEVKQSTWKAALGYWQRSQGPISGAWGYRPLDVGTGSMTCAGVASVLIASSHVNSKDAQIQQDHCVCGDGESDLHVYQGLEWLGKNHSVRGNPREGRRFDRKKKEDDLYYLYAMERVGRISAQRFFYRKVPGSDQPQKFDWYRQGVAYLLDTQDHKDGSWTGKGHAEAGNKSISTSFALLFLAKGKRPVLISKLQRAGGDWNRVQHDLTNLSRYIEKKWKIPLTWQVINSEQATANDYSQTPVLFLSGSKSFQFTPEQRRELRRYVEQGGFIFADGCCGDAGFDVSLKKELKEIFPEAGYELQPLQADHPIWSIDEKVGVDHVDPDGRWLWGINFACKTSVIYCPGNLSCYWELGASKNNDQLAKSVQAEIDTCRAIGVNVLAYATNRRLKEKLAIPRELPVVRRQNIGQRGHFAIAKLEHSGGCDAAPRAITNLMEGVAHSLQLHTSTETPLISLTDEDLFDYHFVYMHGRHDFRLSVQEKRQLKTFVERGGTVMADAICASPSFANAFRREMEDVFQKPLEAIDADHVLLSAKYGGDNLEEVVRRESVRNSNGVGWEVLERRGPPQLEGLTVDEDRLGVVFSPLDLSCALEKHVSPHCRGYTPDDAARIAINVIYYSLHE